MTMKIPSDVQAVVAAVIEAGGRPLIVGGAVRDSVLGLDPKDFDVEVFGLEQEDLTRALNAFSVNAVGSSFGVLKVSVDGGEAIDVSLPRRESKEGRGHRGFMTTADPNMSFEEAAARRDFTINSIAYDPVKGGILDTFGGIQDLHDRVLRATSGAFCEDPLRVLRACQFAARFNMRLATSLLTECRRMNDELPSLPAERLWEEWKKLLLKSPKPSVGIEAMRETGVLRTLFPEIHALDGVPQDPEWHPEGECLKHSNMVLDEAAEITRRDGLEGDEALIVLLGALCHDLGKPSTTEFLNGRWRSRGHEEAGVEPTQSFLERIGCPPKIVEAVLPLVAHHLKPSMLWRDKAGMPAIRRLALKAPLERLVRVAEADFLGRTTEAALTRDYEAGRWLLGKAKTLNIQTEGPKPLLLGRHLLRLGYKPGPEMGAVLKQAFEAQLDGEFDDEAGAEAWAKAKR